MRIGGTADQMTAEQVSAEGNVPNNKSAAGSTNPIPVLRPAYFRVAGNSTMNLRRQSSGSVVD
jgi:hypothetical protein